MTSPTITNAMFHLASYGASAAWQIPLLFAGGWLSSRVLRWLSPEAEHNVWAMTLLLCVVIPALPAPHIRGRAVTVETAVADMPNTVSEQTHARSLGRAPRGIPMAVVQATCGLWTLTTILAAIRFGLAIRRTRRLVQMASPCTLKPELEEVWLDCLRRYGLQNVEVLSSPSIEGPMTAALRGHVLLLPEGFVDEASTVDFRAAASHECAHMQRNDFRMNLAYGLMTLPLALHPVMPLVKRQLIASREIVCDRAAAEVMGSARAYRGALLRLATQIVVNRKTHSLAIGAAVGIFNSNSLEERMERLSTPTRISGTSARIVLTTMAVVCLAGTSFAAAVGAVRLAPLTYASTSMPISPISVNQALNANDPAKANATQRPFQPVKLPAKPAVYNLGGDVTRPKLVYQVDPDFPQELRQRVESAGGGECRIGLIVDTTGRPQGVHITQSLGKGFDDNALAAVRQYRFAPAMRHGKAVAVALNISVNYQIF